MHRKLNNKYFNKKNYIVFASLFVVLISLLFILFTANHAQAFDDSSTDNKTEQNLNVTIEPTTEGGAVQALDGGSLKYDAPKDTQYTIIGRNLTIGNRNFIANYDRFHLFIKWVDAKGDEITQSTGTLSDNDYFGAVFDIAVNANYNAHADLDEHGYINFNGELCVPDVETNWTYSMEDEGVLLNLRSPIPKKGIRCTPVPYWGYQFIKWVDKSGKDLTGMYNFVPKNMEAIALFDVLKAKINVDKYNDGGHVESNNNFEFDIKGRWNYSIDNNSKVLTFINKNTNEKYSFKPIADSNFAPCGWKLGEDIIKNSWGEINITGNMKFTPIFSKSISIKWENATEGKDFKIVNSDGKEVTEHIFTGYNDVSTYTYIYPKEGENLNQIEFQLISSEGPLTAKVVAEDGYSFDRFELNGNTVTPSTLPTFLTEDSVFKVYFKGQPTPKPEPTPKGDGSHGSNITNNASPQTLDNNTIIIWAALLSIAISSIYIYRRQKSSVK